MCTEAVLAGYRTRLLDQMEVPKPPSERFENENRQRQAATFTKGARGPDAVSAGSGKVRVFTEGGFPGMPAWVAEGCRAGGLLGLRRTRAPVIVTLGDTDEAVAAARQPSRR